jgi:hypothetical protein
MLCVCICGVCMYVCRVFSIIVQHAHANKCTEFVVSFMMGTRSRFGACNPVLLSAGCLRCSVSCADHRRRQVENEHISLLWTAVSCTSKSICAYSLTYTHHDACMRKTHALWQAWYLQLPLQIDCMKRSACFLLQAQRVVWPQHWGQYDICHTVCWSGIRPTAYPTVTRSRSREYPVGPRRWTYWDTEADQ